MPATHDTILGLSTVNQQAIADIRGEEPPDASDDFSANFFPGDAADEHELAEQTGGSDQGPGGNVSANESIQYAIRDILDGQYVLKPASH